MRELLQLTSILEVLYLESRFYCILQAYWNSLDEEFTSREIFAVIEKFQRNGACLGAGTKGGSDKKNVILSYCNLISLFKDKISPFQTKGIVQGHAYSILDVKYCQSICFIKLRNPWGTFEWTGNWSDKSSLWATNPGAHQL